MFIGPHPDRAYTRKMLREKYIACTVHKLESKIYAYTLVKMKYNNILNKIRQGKIVAFILIFIINVLSYIVKLYIVVRVYCLNT